MTGVVVRAPGSTISASIRLLRPGSVVASVAICAVGAFLAQPVTTSSLTLGLVAVGASVAASNVFNDILDLEADRINVPGRPLPSQSVSVRAAWVWCFGLLLTALGSGWLLGPLHGVWVSLVLVVSAGYSLRLKKVLILGGLVVSALLGSVLGFGASLGSGVSSAVLLGSVEIALFTFGRETLKGVRDTDGDQSAGVSTIASVWGRNSAIWIFILACLAVGVVAAMAGHLLHVAVMSLCVTLPAVVMGIQCLRSDQDSTIGAAIGRSAWLWATGLLGIALLGV